MSEQNPWAQLEDGQPDPFSPDQDGVIDLTQLEQTSSSPAEDVESTDKPAKKRSILPILIGVALVGVSAAGYVGYGLYQKLFPSADVARSGGVALIDTTRAPEPASSLPGVQSTESSASLPITPAGVSSLPISSGAQAPVDEDLAPFAAVTNVNTSPGSEPSPGSVEPAVMAEPQVPVEPVSVDKPAVVEPAVSTPAVSPTTPAAPRVEVQAPAKPVELPNVPAASASASAASQEAAAAAAKAVQQAAQRAAKPAPQKAVAKAQVRKPAREYTSAGKPKQPSESGVARRSRNDLGQMSNYSLLAIEPKHGAYQQAWVRDAGGRVRVVGKGDVIDGARVTDVQFAKGRVMTDRGEIRK